MGWISVKDRLPKDNEYVLVFDDSEDICVGYISYDTWNFYQGRYASDALLFNVTHWMPLPKWAETRDET